MRGLELAEAFYREVALPRLTPQWVPWLERAAVGLVGEGSECFGFDDEQSRDHDWGPGFCIWLEAADHAQVGERLQAAYLALPESFQGYRRRSTPWGRDRLGVSSIGDFYRRHLGLAHAPSSLEGWLRLSEQGLAACTNGRVFSDPLGRFSQVRLSFLAYPPDDVRRLRAARLCLSAGQAGQYNFSRCSARGEVFAARYAETKFAADLMALVYLLNRRYAPFYKWLHRGLAELPLLGRTAQTMVNDLLVAQTVDIKAGLIDELACLAGEELSRQGLSMASSRFLLDHVGPLQEGIGDREFAAKYRLVLR